MLNKKDLSYARNEFVYFVSKKSEKPTEDAFYSFWVESHGESEYYLYYRQGKEHHTNIKVFKETSIKFTFCTLNE